MSDEKLPDVIIPPAPVVAGPPPVVAAPPLPEESPAPSLPKPSFKDRLKGNVAAKAPKARPPGKPGARITFRERMKPGTASPPVHDHARNLELSQDRRVLYLQHRPLQENAKQVRFKRK